MSFSLSTREGHMIGRSLDAQSSSLNKSTVAANARSAAFRACTKGSRRERPKAAARTFARLYKHVNKTERGKKRQSTYIYTEIACYFAQTNRSVRTDSRLLVVCGLGEMSQKLAIDHSIRELWNNRQDSSHCLLANDRCHI